MPEIPKTADVQFPMAIYGYNKRKVDEHIHELLTYCWNLEEENKALKKDLSFYSKQLQLKQVSDVVSMKWEEIEYSMLLGLVLQEDILDYEGNVAAERNTVITSYLIESLISKGLYGELIAAADPYKGVGHSDR